MKPEFLILVADDFEGLADTVAELLRSEEAFDAVIALDGAAALEVVRTQRPHACLLDIGMRKMSGIEVAQAVRNEFGPDRPLLIGITGGAIQEVAATGVFDFVFEKPLEIDSVLVELEKALRLRNDIQGRH